MEKSSPKTCSISATQQKLYEVNNCTMGENKFAQPGHPVTNQCLQCPARFQTLALQICVQTSDLD
jgi:hypothetical protein